MQDSLAHAIGNAELSTQPLLGKDTVIKDSHLGYACEVGDRCKFI